MAPHLAMVTRTWPPWSRPMVNVHKGVGHLHQKTNWKAEFSSSEISMGYSKFIQDLVGMNKLCYPIKINVLDLMVQSNFHTRSFWLNIGPTPLVISSNFCQGAQNELESLKNWTKSCYRPNWHSRTNYIVKIFIWACFPWMLTKVNCWAILKAKMQNSVQTHIEGLDS